MTMIISPNNEDHLLLVDQTREAQPFTIYTHRRR